MAITSWIPPPRPDPETLKNPLPFAPFPLLQLRAGRVKRSLANGRIESAIFKSPLSGPIQITKNGITSDEHAFEPHRSPDKALLHYCTAHYSDWKTEIPASAHLFRPGAFGENLFTEQVSEMTICIGDRIAIGKVVVEVSEPRAPCFKLNHRFETKDMAKRTQTLLRTGWLYRVITPGTVEVGEMISLLERPFPEWSVARVMYYLFLETDNAAIMKEIVQLGPLGEDIKNKFRARLTKGKTEDQNSRIFGGEAEKMDTWSDFRLVERRIETSTVSAFVFEALEDMQDPLPVQPGSHVRLKLGGKLVRAYSVIGGSSKRFELGIALDIQSSGGSKYVHENVQVGHVLSISHITTSFPLAKDADRHIMLAGGIGITAFLAALDHLQTSKQDFHLHYAVADETPFESRVTTLGTKATIYRKSLGQRMNISSILSHADSRTHIYTCGPARLMDAVTSVVHSNNIPETSLHVETFTVTTSGDPFTAELKQSAKIVEIAATQSLLDALRAAGMEVESSCEVGNCGTCKVDVCGGRVEHRGTGLLEDEKGESMLACVSRGVGRIVIDL
ncbi:3-chlorobenzoate-3,4-dioxygenase reductase subunit [Plenodomus tracheiphilus IPT5]|uniref:3-chlorobenzoate-3,4-dioxygenase reductase subunit n=1 Tax=Plenodomus tracheiphilus IPT5 TaxID=1408161 RepID=A0A6A7AVZ7_9PLEO|nr:3-chlorobenzoate-3,4-dioxygenase reductase subunit [Plenodomus tracheiphilus IPT5]